MAENTIFEIPTQTTIFEAFYLEQKSYATHIVTRCLNYFCIPWLVFSGFCLLQFSEIQYKTGSFTITLVFIVLLILSQLWMQIDYYSGMISSLFYGVFMMFSRIQYLNARENSKLSKEWIPYNIQVCVGILILREFVLRVFERKKMTVVKDIKL